MISGISTRRLALDANVRRVDPGTRTAPLASTMQAGNAERARLYSSARWRRMRRVFLAANPLCMRCNAIAVVVDHRDGHQHHDWLLRFWDHTRWDALCLACHAAKSAGELAAWRQAGEAGGRGSGTDPRRAPTAEPLRARAAIDI